MLSASDEPRCSAAVPWDECCWIVYGCKMSEFLKGHQRHEYRNTDGVYTELTNIAVASNHECRQKARTTDYCLIGQR